VTGRRSPKIEIIWLSLEGIIGADLARSGPEPAARVRRGKSAVFFFLVARAASWVNRSPARGSAISRMAQNHRSRCGCATGVRLTQLGRRTGTCLFGAGVYYGAGASEAICAVSGGVPGGAAIPPARRSCQFARLCGRDMWCARFAKTHVPDYLIRADTQRAESTWRRTRVTAYTETVHCSRSRSETTRPARIESAKRLALSCLGGARNACSGGRRPLRQ